MNTNTYLRKYHSLLSRIRFYVKNGTWNLLSAARKSRLLKLLDILALKLMKSGKRVATAAALGLALTIVPTQVQSQNFEECSSFEEFGQGDVAFYDMDNDGDLDALVAEIIDIDGDSEFRYYENIGDASAPVWAAPVTNPFGLDPEDALNSLVFADLDGDNDMDIIVGGKKDGSNEIWYYENTGTIGNPSFEDAERDQFGLDDIYGDVPAPTFKDIDGDGDLDAFVGDLGTIRYYENTGDAMNPNFVEMDSEDIGIPDPAGKFVAPEFFDIDGDGDCDLFVGSKVGGTMIEEIFGIIYTENIGDAMNPDFNDGMGAQINPFGIDTIIVGRPDPVFVDIYEGRQSELAIGSGGIAPIGCFMQPAPIPTLSQWGMIVLALMTSIFGLLIIKSGESLKKGLRKTLPLLILLAFPFLSQAQLSESVLAGVVLKSANAQTLKTQLISNSQLLAENGIVIKNIFESAELPNYVGVFLESSTPEESYAFLQSGFLKQLNISEYPNGKSFMMYGDVEIKSELSSSDQYLFSAYSVKDMANFKKMLNSDKMKNEFGMEAVQIMPYKNSDKYVQVIYRVGDQENTQRTMNSSAFKQELAQNKIVALTSYFIKTTSI